MAPMIRKATRRKAKLRLALIGPTGSGKTMSSLKLAFGIGGKVGIIDTENGSADLYADIGEYDVITLEKPYTVQKYRDALSAFEREGYSTIIVDSLTHAWSGSGGLLDKQGQLESSGRAKNSFAAWREITPEHNSLVEALLSSPAHIIATMRVKTEYVLEPDSRGKMVPVKKGLQPMQRDGVEYEFTVVMDVDAGHKATASKDRTTIFNGWYDTISEDTGRKLRDWLEMGAEAPRTITPPADKLPVIAPDGKTHEMDVAKWLTAVSKAIAGLRDAREVRAWRQEMTDHLAAALKLDEDLAMEALRRIDEREQDLTGAAEEPELVGAEG